MDFTCEIARIKTRLFFKLGADRFFEIEKELGLISNDLEDYYKNLLNYLSLSVGA